MHELLKSTRVEAALNYLFSRFSEPSCDHMHQLPSRYQSFIKLIRQFVDFREKNCKHKSITVVATAKHIK